MKAMLGEPSEEVVFTDQQLCQTRVPDVEAAALHERSGSSTKGRTPNIRYFDPKLSIVAIYALF